MDCNSNFKISTDSLLSYLFCNIDGNQSNFDAFIASTALYNHEFSFIAIAETNCDSANKDLYDIPGYVSEYNDKFGGSGPAKDPAPNKQKERK